MADNYDLDILGQKLRWPSTIPAAISFVCLVVIVITLVLGIPYLVKRLGDPAALKLLEETGFAKVSAGTVNGISGTVSEKIDKILVFSIPNQYTKYDVFFEINKTQMQESDFKQFKSDYQWYFASNIPMKDPYSAKRTFEPEVDIFLQELERLKSEGSVQGYDIYESMGRGSHALKRGYTIRLTVPEGSIYNRSALAKLYKNVWNRPDVYIEEYQVARTAMTKNATLP